MAGQRTLMRVVGGRLKGRNLASPSSREIRPTADRLRESLFNILIHAHDDPISGARVLDLFAGTGALGIEAISRGAAYALFVDDGVEARALLRSNTESLGLGGVTRIFRSALRQGPGGKGARLRARWRLAYARCADRGGGSGGRRLHCTAGARG